MIAAGNRILHTYYCYAGGHGSWNDSCYDCSGSVSYVLHAAGMLDSPEASTGLESWGSPGRGRWITVYANSAHTWIAIAGRAFDTADFGGPDIPGGSEPTDTTCEAKAYRLRVTLGGSSFEAPIDPPTPVCEHGSLFFDNFSAAG